MCDMRNARGCLWAAFAAMLPWACASESGLSAVHGELVPSVAALDFGTLYLGETTTRTVTLNNPGSGRFSFAHLQVTAAQTTFTLQGDGAARTYLAPGATWAITLRFAPESAGPAHAELMLIDMDNRAQTLVTLEGVGLAPLSCDDANPCTDDRFDVESERCVSTPRTGACDDQSACTAGDTCVGAQCVGVSVACPDPDPCHTGACDAAEGCIAVPRPGICDDDDPCTIDHCDPELGCSWENAPNGTLCGAAGCDGADICFSGSCVHYVPGDGFPCDDGDRCTEGDTCQSGVCTGAPASRPPELLGQITTFGAGSGQVEILDDDRLLFVDPLGADLVVTRVRVAGEALGAVARERVSDTTLRSGVWRFDAAHVMTCVLAEDGLRFVVVATSDDDPWQVVGALDLGVSFESSWSCGAVRGPGEVVYLLHHLAWPYDDLELALVPIDLSNPAAPVAHAALPVPAGIGKQREPAARFAYDASRERLLVGDPQGLLVVDVDAPLLPRAEGYLITGIRPHAIAVSPELLLLYPRAEDTLDSQAGMQLRDPWSGALQSTLGIPAHSTTSGAPSIEGSEVTFIYDGHHGWDGQLAPDDVQVWDASNPSAPTRVASEDLANDPTGLVRRGDLLAVEASLGTAVRRRFAGLHNTSGPGHGVVHRGEIVQAFVLYSATGTHWLDLSDPSHPEFSAGQQFARPAALLGFGLGGDAPWRLASDLARYDRFSSDDTYTYRDLAGLRVDVADPTAPVLMGAVHLDGPAGTVAHTFTDGERFFGHQNGLRAFARPGPDTDDALLSIEASLSETAGAANALFSMDGDRLVVATTQWSSTAATYSLVDYRPGPPPSFTEVFTESLLVPQDLLLRGRALLVLSVLEDGQAMLRLFDVSEAGFAEEAALVYPGAADLLAFDGRVAYVATPTEVGVLTVDPDGLTLVQQVPTATPAVSAVEVAAAVEAPASPAPFPGAPPNEVLVLVERTQVSVYTPVCIAGD